MIDEAVKASRPEVGSSRLRNIRLASLQQKKNGMRSKLHQDLGFGENLNGDTDPPLLSTAYALQKLVSD